MVNLHWPIARLSIDIEVRLSLRVSADSQQIGIQLYLVGLAAMETLLTLVFSLQIVRRTALLASYSDLTRMLDPEGTGLKWLMASHQRRNQIKTNQKQTEQKG